jgi:electron transfer flavoprotein beta subunit
MIFCGQQAIDGNTGQVGPRIAEALGLPQITSGMTCELKGDELHVFRETEAGKEVVGVKFPCLITFTKSRFSLRLPSVKRKIAARKMEIMTLCADDLVGINRAKIGLNGSPTRVLKMVVPQAKKNGTIFTEGPLEESAKKLAQLLVDNRVIINVV